MLVCLVKLNFDKTRMMISKIKVKVVKFLFGKVLHKEQFLGGTFSRFNTSVPLDAHFLIFRPFEEKNQFTPPQYFFWKILLHFTSELVDNINCLIIRHELFCGAVLTILSSLSHDFLILLN